MEKQNKTILTLLIVSLVINCYMVLSINNLREITHNTNQYCKDYMYNIDEINKEIDAINKEQQWISDVEIKDGGFVEGKQILELSWEIYDYILGSEATLYYRKSGEEDFKQVSVESKNTNSLMAVLKIDKEDQLEWIIQYDDEEYLNEYISYTYDYYITLNDGNRILTSKIKKMNLEKYIKYYFNAQTDVTFNKDRIPRVIVLDIKGVFGGKIAPQKAFIELYDNNELTEEELNFESSKEEYYSVKWENDDQSFDKLVVRIQYEDGKEFQKQIWSKDNE